MLSSLTSHPPYFLKQALSLGPGLPIKLGCLAGEFRDPVPAFPALASLVCPTMPSFLCEC